MIKVLLSAATENHRVLYEIENEVYDIFSGYFVRYFRHFNSNNVHKHAQSFAYWILPLLVVIQPTAHRHRWHFIDFFLFGVYGIFFRLIIWKVWNKVKAHCDQTNLFWYFFPRTFRLSFVCVFLCLCERVVVVFFLFFWCIWGLDYLFERTHFRLINHWFVLPISYFAQTHIYNSENGQTAEITNNHYACGRQRYPPLPSP